jgi:thiamine pyrophosphokinase
VPSPSDARPVIVVAGGDAAPRAALRTHLPQPSTVIAADSGLEHAQMLGLHVDRVVGDLDSVDRDALHEAVQQGTVVDAHPTEKDQTDLELALDCAALVAAPSNAPVIVVTSVGGRLDHGLANLLLLASPAYEALRIDAYVDDWLVTVVRARTTLFVGFARLLTLLPVGGAAVGVTTEQLSFPLRDETLTPGTSRGVSNIAEADEVVVDLRAGVLLALRKWTD